MCRSLKSLALISLLLPALHAVASEPISWEAAAEHLDRYCYECHGNYSTDAGLDLMNIVHQSDLQAEPQKWANILHALRTHYMPHPDGKRIKTEARQQLITKIQYELLNLAADHDAQSAPLRRLNRIEYSNTLNDLFGLNRDWGQSLPADNAGYGFDNIAATLTLSPLLMERYFDVAAEVALLAVPQKLSPSQWNTPASTFTGGMTYQGNKKLIAASGALHAVRHRVYFPGNGRYELSLQLSAQQAGDEDARAELFVDGQSIDSFRVSSGKDDPAQVIKVELQVDRLGEHELSLQFKNDFYREHQPAPDDANSKARTEDRNLIFHGLSIQGPYQNDTDWHSPFLERHFNAPPESLSTAEIKQGIHRFASRAYRRPATEAELHSLWQVYDTNNGSIQENKVRQGLHAVIDAVLTSPAFLFRFEGKEDGQQREYALASWLSYFLWSSMPDDRLFQLAHSQQLHSQLESEIHRMLNAPQASALAKNFAGQWWHTRDLEIHKPDRSIYQHADSKLLAAMREETRRFFQHVLNEDRPLLDFLNADYTFVNGALAKHYGIKGVTGESFQLVSLEGSPRRGIWTQAGILTVTSYPNYTSPVLRGKWVLENLIGLSPPPPPDNIPSLPGTDGTPDASDLRASLAAHREDPDCASCHDIMDPFGLALEHFDAVGGLRSLQERKALSEETLFDGRVIRSPIDLAEYLEVERSDDFIRNVSHKLAIYASGRGLNWQDDAAIERAARFTKAHDYRFSALIQAIVNEFAPIDKSTTVTATHH